MAPKATPLRCHLCIIALLAAFANQGHAQIAKPSPDYFAPLKDLDRPVSRSLSSQNFTRCCLRAMDEWQKNPTSPDIVVESSKNPSKIFRTAKELRDNSPEEQFPCGAEYEGDKNGATRVKISYQWCRSHCGGWQRSRSAVLEQWVQPFVGFILPAAVFCLNVPRKKVINIPDDFFPNVLNELTERWMAFTREAATAKKLKIVELFVNFVTGNILTGLLLVARGVLAATLGLLNIVVWVLVVFSTAAPMILSGLYEATIDRQLLRAIEKDAIIDVEDEKKTTSGDDKDPYIDPKRRREIKYRIHLLYAILVGNLALPKTDKDPKHTAWDDVDVLVRHLDPEPIHYEREKYKAEKERTENRLKSMLECQASFGGTIGVPVAFFLGSFLFSIFGNREKLGNTDVSLALAFGEWWMIIPHVAIVSGCLLAGNNPNTLEAIMSGIDDVKLQTHESTGRWWWAPFYNSVYQPVWMWERGRNKRQWFLKVKGLLHKSDTPVPTARPKDDSWLRRPWKRFLAYITPTRGPTNGDGWLRRHWKRYLASTLLKDVPNVDGPDWIFLILIASILIVIPFVLAYVTSFYTPTIGLSCRTFTFVLYFIFQCLLTILWAYDFHAEKAHPFYRENSRHPTIFFGLTLLFFIGSSFTAIIGTFMQILGVYRNCLCNIPMGYWSGRDYSFTVSSNTAEGIYYADVYWLSTGIASICLLVIFCYLGWWYQRHWRTRFNSVVGKVLNTKQKTSDKDNKNAQETEKGAQVDPTKAGAPSHSEPSTKDGDAIERITEVAQK